MHCQNVLNVMDNNGYVGSSMARTKATLSAMFSDACENGLIAMNPVTKSVKCPKKPEKNTRVLTLDEQERFLTAARESINYNHFLFILGHANISMTMDLYVHVTEDEKEKEMLMWGIDPKA